MKIEIKFSRFESFWEIDTSIEFAKKVKLSEMTLTACVIILRSYWGQSELSFSPKSSPKVTRMNTEPKWKMLQILIDLWNDAISRLTTLQQGSRTFWSLLPSWKFCQDTFIVLLKYDFHWGLSRKQTEVSSEILSLLSPYERLMELIKIDVYKF